MASSSLSYDSDASLESYDDSDANADLVSNIIPPPIFIIPKEYPHYIIVGHGRVNSVTFTNMTRCKINYLCRRGDVMRSYIHSATHLIDHMEKMCKNRIVVKEHLGYGEEIDNTEYKATNEIESRLFGIYTCDVLDSPIFGFQLNTTYYLETLLNFLKNYTKRNNSSEYFEVSIIGCRPVDDRPTGYEIAQDLHMERLTGQKRTFSNIGGKPRKIKTRKIKTRKIKTRKIKRRKIKTRNKKKKNKNKK